MVQISYGATDLIGEATNADVDTAEETVLEITTRGSLGLSQLTGYLTVDLGTHTTVRVRLYYLDADSGTYFQVLKHNISSGLLEDFFWEFDSSTPANGIVDMPISSCLGLKITAQGVGGANASVGVKLMGRKN